MGTNGVPWAKAGCDGRIIMMRRRNNSSTENPAGIVFLFLFTFCTKKSAFLDGGSSLLCNPSPALQRLLPNEEISSIVRSDTSLTNKLDFLQRPVLQFVMRQHDLESLRMCMKHALRFVTFQQILNIAREL